MLLDCYRQLLTAFVDGELTSLQRRRVARLLRRSAEARQFLQQLQEDSEGLRRLPQPSLPIDLTESVLRRIAERRLTPHPCRPAKIRLTPSWARPLLSWAAAAAVLLMLGAASYLYFAASLAHRHGPGVAEKQREMPSPIIPNEPDPSAIATQDNRALADKTPSSKLDNPSVVKTPEGDNRPDDNPSTPSLPPKEETVLTERLEMFRLSKVPDILPVVLKVRELDQEVVRNHLIMELGKDRNFRLELPCQNGTRAFERVEGAAKAMNLDLVIERRARDRLKLPRWKTNYVVFVENLTPEESAHFIQLIGAVDTKIAAGKLAETQFDRLVLTHMIPQHHKELSALLLGLDPTGMEPSTKGPPVTDPRKPLSDLTPQQAKPARAGQGSNLRPEPDNSSSKPSEHLVLVLAYNPVRPDPRSAEIKRFLESRKSTKPGTIRLLLILRSHAS
jgi:hypothetical protein